ncbi:hypothetical protein QBC33DRAFT_582916 [Phialemonium atrogriseum]|uniref:CBF1-interacting co-repressor CIR N-terminal domain-containing protein n=1 Tax=Phialemonium atrogriseum TaxID=1093897 RepID=A0AAJ0C989_9PEZI|nr:uncharacterized protein QBC33DRAFT_582916 [Phialemonium atrogriseum]KAK1772321.1 hypothetical protein QBC33DRAFT_582916 [Phialemonium atrogriseum]
MPLHLLGKKSWNVYNAANIERVRRDEAAAAAREAAEEQRMQEDDAARRLAILRGEEPPPPPPPPPRPEPESSSRRPPEHIAGERPERRKRKRAGEDDTDFEMRVATEQQRTPAAAAAGGEALSRLLPGPAAGAAVSLVDERGHVALFAPPPLDERAERDGGKKREREREDQSQGGMRFSDAAGRGGAGLVVGGAGPWYAQAGGDGSALGAEAPSKDVWGNEDPRRRMREAARLDASDPLAMMKRGAAKVRELGKERSREAKERERELRQLRKEERRRERRRRREGRDRDDVDDLEGFSLDGPSPAV